MFSRATIIFLLPVNSGFLNVYVYALHSLAAALAQFNHEILELLLLLRNSRKLSPEASCSLFFFVRGHFCFHGTDDGGCGDGEVIPTRDVCLGTITFRLLTCCRGNVEVRSPQRVLKGILGNVGNQKVR